MTTVSADVLVLNADYTPYDLVDLEKAWSMLSRKAVYVLTAYPNKFLRSMSEVFPWPAVVVLRRFQAAGRKVKFSRANVFARDTYTCQYCGSRPTDAKGLPDRRQLTFDHVVPRCRSKGGKVRLRDGRRANVTSWDNIVTCCYPCNQKKGDRTPEEAGMPLRRAPRRPNAVTTVLVRLRKTSIPDEWSEFLPDGSPWHSDKP